MTPEQRRMVMDLRDPPSADEGDWEMLDDVLRGDEALSISHEGGGARRSHEVTCRGL